MVRGLGFFGIWNSSSRCKV